MTKLALVTVLALSLTGVLFNFGQAHGFETTVYLMQEKLLQKGIDPGPLDGVAGILTGNAIRKFQEAENLPVTGRMDEAVLEKLGLKKIRTFFLLQGRKFAAPKTDSDITIKTVEHGLMRLSGHIEFGMVRGEQQKLIWNDGATHRLEGSVEFGIGGFEDYIFHGDLLDPLTFRVISGVGYVFIGGKGNVIKKSTQEIIQLGE